MLGGTNNPKGSKVKVECSLDKREKGNALSCTSCQRKFMKQGSKNNNICYTGISSVPHILQLKYPWAINASIPIVYHTEHIMVTVQIPGDWGTVLLLRLQQSE